MRGPIAVGIGLALALAAFSAPAATKAPGRAPPACAAITFRPLPPGMSDGEQQAGMYRSRNGRLELRAEVKQGAPVNYYVTTGGKHIAAAPPSLPVAAASCAASTLRSSLPMPASSALHCCMGRTAAAGISARPELSSLARDRAGVPTLSSRRRPGSISPPRRTFQALHVLAERHKLVALAGGSRPSPG